MIGSVLNELHQKLIAPINSLSCSDLFHFNMFIAENWCNIIERKAFMMNNLLINALKRMCDAHVHNTWNGTILHEYVHVPTLKQHENDIINNKNLITNAPPVEMNKMDNITMEHQNSFWNCKSCLSLCVFWCEIWSNFGGSLSA